MHLNKAAASNMAANISSYKTYQNKNINILETLIKHLRKLNINA